MRNSGLNFYLQSKSVKTFFLNLTTVNCGTKDGNITLQAVNNVVDYTWIRGHKGAIVKGIINNELGLNNITIQGEIDGEKFFFAVDNTCNETKVGLVCFIYYCLNSFYEFSYF